MKIRTTNQSIDLAPVAAGVDGAVECCANLVSNTIGGRRALRVAPQPAPVVERELMPLALWHHPDEDDTATTLYSGRTVSDMSLWVGVADDEPYEVEHPAVREIYCAIATAEGFTAMTSAGPLRLLPRDGQWVCREAEVSALLVPELVTERAGMLTSKVAERTFSKVTITRTDIDVADSQLRMLASDLCGAYEAMASVAANGGLWLQPVGARIVMRDAMGNVVLESVGMMSRTKVQCCGSLTAACTKPSADSVEVSAMPLSGEAYRLKLRLSAACANGLNAAGVKRVEVLVGPQCHPMDVSAEMPVRWTGVSTQQPALTVAVPGATSHFASMQGVWTRRLRAVLSDTSAILSNRLTLTAPFEAGDYSVAAPPFEGVATENRVATAALAQTGQPVSGSGALLRSLQAPSVFIARCGCVCGDKVVWGNLTALPPATVDLANICTFDTAAVGNWTAEVRVALRSGKELAYSVSGQGVAPSGWAPAVAWPMADAMSIDVYVSHGNVVLHGHADLESAADESMAFMIDADFEMRPWTQYFGAIPPPRSDGAGGAAESGAVAVALLSAPTTPVKAGLCCPAPIVALAPARRTLSAWDSASVRAYAFGAAGTYAINAGSGVSTPLSSALVDRREVTHGATVAVTPDGVTAGSGSTMLRLSGTTMRRRPVSMELRGVAWSYAGELGWLLDDKGNVALYDTEADALSSLWLPEAVKAVVSVGPEPMIVTANGVWRPSTPAYGRPVKWRRVAEVPCGWRVSGVCVHASASDFQGSIRVEVGYTAGGADDDDDDIATVLNIDGPIDRPIQARMDMPLRPVAVIELAGEVSGDFALYGVTLKLSR